MDLSVIENDPTEVKKYLQNFVPINYYRVLGDEYLHQVRATLMHTTSMAELYNPVYGGLINDLTVTVGNNYATVNTRIDIQVDAFSALAIKTETIAVEAANANASIIEIQQVSASQNQAQASVNQRLEASLDDIVVGGRNIMKNSDFSKGYRAWQEASITIHDHYIGTMHKVAATGIVGSLMGIYPLEIYQNMAMVEGTQYSISFYAYGSITLMDEIYLTSPSGAPIKLPSVVISTDLTNRRHITFTAPIGGGGIGIILGATVSSLNDWFSISRVKVELGNRPTDWSPAPEDTEGYIAAVQSSIDTFKDVQVTRNLATAQSLELLDSRVGTNAASILTEKNTRVDQYSALSELTVELEAKTANNAANIGSVDRAYAEKFNANASRLTTLETTTDLSSAKITSLEEASSDLGGAIASTNTTLTAKINAVTIGGRNLLRNADFKLGVDTWGTATIVASKNILGNLVTVTNTGTTTNYFGLTPVSIFSTVSLISGKEYVLSFYAKGNITSINDIWFKADGEIPIKLENVDITDTLDSRYEIVFIPTFTTETGSIVIAATGYTLNSWFAVVAVKLEQGNKATDWTAAPEDIGQEIAAVEANINEFKAVQANENIALAEQTDTLSIKTDGQIDTVTNSLSIVRDDLGDIKAEAKVLTTVAGKVSGWKNLNDGTLSSFDILADNFSVGNGTVNKKPFSIVGTDITFNGKVSFSSMSDSISSNQIPIGTVNLNHFVAADKTYINTASTDANYAKSTADGIKNNIYYTGTTAINGGVIRTDSITAVQIAANTITAAQIAANTITATQIAASTITGAKMVADTLTAREIAASTITATQIAANTITAAKIATGTITAASGVIADAAITTAKIANLAVSTAQLDNAAITTAKIGIAQIDTLQIAGEAVTIPRLVYMPTGSKILVNSTAQAGVVYTPSVPLPIEMQSGTVVTTAKKWSFEVGRVTFNPEGGSVSISFSADGLYMKGYATHSITPSAVLAISVHRLDLATPLRTKYSESLLAVQGAFNIPSHTIIIPSILDAPPVNLGAVTYIAEVILLSALRVPALSSTKPLDEASTDAMVGFGTASLQVTGVKR